MQSTRRDNRHRLAEIALRQSGYFTAAQARELGYAYPAQKYNADHGNWLRVDRAIYRLRDWPSGPHDDFVRWRLWSKGRAVVSHDSALSVHGLGTVDPTRVHLTVPPGFRQVAAGAVLHKAMLDDADVERREGFVITTPIRSILDAAAGDLDVDQLRLVVQDALDRGFTTRRRLIERADATGARAALRIERAIRDLDSP